MNEKADHERDLLGADVTYEMISEHTCKLPSHFIKGRQLGLKSALSGKWVWG